MFCTPLVCCGAGRGAGLETVGEGAEGASPGDTRRSAERAGAAVAGRGEGEAGAGAEVGVGIVARGVVDGAGAGAGRATTGASAATGASSVPSGPSFLVLENMGQATSQSHTGRLSDTESPTLMRGFTGKSP